MQIPTPTEAARALFESLVHDDERVEVKPMFGNLGAFGPAERPMGGYVSLPSGVDEEAVRPWVRKSLDYVGGLPPKVKKPKAEKPARKGR
jgi:hypothetical protein